MQELKVEKIIELLRKHKTCIHAKCETCKFREDCGAFACIAAADAIEELSRAQEQWIEQERNALLQSIPRWIPVTERLPERNGFYLCLYESKAKGGVAMDEGLSISQFINKKWSLFDSYVVTHWLPIPEPPKEE